MNGRIPEATFTEAKARCVTGLETMLALEADRARSEEARLAAELAEKDAAIRVLAEALSGAYEFVQHGRHPHGMEAKIAAALRRAGVLK